MSAEFDKENIADGLFVAPLKAKNNSSKNPSKKSRSKSIGPGGLDAPLKEDSGNRRKSAIIPAVKSILSREDEAKRREARRKSLANRRVSFAPEATLHTWDVIEYVRDATTSSSTSSDSRRGSSGTGETPGVSSDLSEPPSTPPEQVEEVEPGSSPANQRDLHQKKRRRSSGIPPMNFNNPDDVFSSSPYGSSPAGGDMDEPESSSESGSDSDDGGSTMMSLDMGDNTGRSIRSLASDESTGSSARLEERLRLATSQAGTQGLDLDENGDMTMEMADDEITASFKPWVNKNAAAVPSLIDMDSPSSGRENGNPFSPAKKANAVTALSAKFGEPDEEDEEEEEEGDDDMSMDITRAIGGIIRPVEQDAGDDATMEFTTALGGIRQDAPVSLNKPQSQLKRRRSSVMDTRTNAHGSPAKKQATRRNSIRPKRSPNEDLGDATMELTMAIGKIEANKLPVTSGRRESVESFGEETMDFTMIVGGIKGGLSNSKDAVNEEDEEAEGGGSGDLSMEFTTVMGGIKHSETPQASPKKPAPAKSPSPVKKTTVSPRKSPGRPKKAQTTPQKSPRKSTRTSLVPATPEQKIDPNSLEFISRSVESARRQSLLKAEVVPSTPQAIANGKTTISPLKSENGIDVQKESVTPNSTVKEPVYKSTTALANSIKLLSTPRKQVPSPFQQTTSTPKLDSAKKAPSPKKSTTPRRKSLSPKKHVRVQEIVPEEHDELSDVKETPEESEGERIELQEFLDITGIRFMDLTTTKRRHTIAPPSLSSSASHLGEGTDFKLKDWVVAAACTEPEYEMYRHSCHELKRFISGGKDVVRQIEANVYADNPALFQEYLSAPPDQRYVMDNQFKNMKTFARLQSKEIWYGWRSNLLRDLQTALIQTGQEFDSDEALLAKQERLLESVLPNLAAEHESMEAERKQLQLRADELNSCDREELEATRETLVSVEDEIAEKKRLIASLQQELAEKEAAIEAAKERKVECAEEIKMAERVREECRGWSSGEVKALQAKVDALESKYGWTISSASTNPSTLTMTYRGEVQIFFHPESFAKNGSPGSKRNSPIRLTYVGDGIMPRPKPLTTSKRFFLQLIRAHLQCLEQSQISIRNLLGLISNGWDRALAVAEGVRLLEIDQIVEESILSDESMAIKANMLLPTLQTKVQIQFEVGAEMTEDGMRTSIKSSAKVFYGERYKEDKMGEFLKSVIGQDVKNVEEMGIWAEAVRDLKARLIARGRKG